jgi:hypothetical protein
MSVAAAASHSPIRHRATVADRYMRFGLERQEQLVAAAGKTSLA